jgi:hypothetical protein
MIRCQSYNDPSETGKQHPQENLKKMHKNFPKLLKRIAMSMLMNSKQFPCRNT